MVRGGRGGQGPDEGDLPSAGPEAERADDALHRQHARDLTARGGQGVELRGGQLVVGLETAIGGEADLLSVREPWRRPFVVGARSEGVRRRLLAVGGPGAGRPDGPVVPGG